MKKLVLSIMAVASLFAGKAYAQHSFGDPNSATYMEWTYDGNPQQVYMDFPNADYAVYNGLITIDIWQGTSLEDKHKVGTGQEKRIDNNTFTCIMDQELAPGAYFIQARTDVFTINESQYLPNEYFKIDFIVPEPAAPFVPTYVQDPEDGATLHNDFVDWNLTFDNAVKAEFNGESQVVEVYLDGELLTTAEIVPNGDNGFTLTNFDLEEDNIPEGAYCVVFPEGTFTAYETEDAEGVEVGEITWTVIFEKDHTTAIESINVQNASNVYDLMGRRMSSANGICIINGVKAVIR